MPHTVDVQLAGLHWQFVKPGALWQFWPWKLDSFTVNCANNAPCVCINMCPSGNAADTPEAFPILSRKASGFFTNTVFHLPDGGALWEMTRTRTGQPLLRLRTDTSWNAVSLLLDETSSAGSAAFEYLAQITPGLFLRQNRVTFHAALVEYRSSAFVICADSGTGKTTHARLWRDHKQALILNGDRAVCSADESGWTAWGTPWSGTSGEQLARNAPLKAFVVLHRADENSVRHLSPMEAFPVLFPHLLYPGWDRAMASRALSCMDDILCRVPVYQLGCRPDVQAVDVLCHALWEDE